MARSFYSFSSFTPNVKSGLTLALVITPSAISLAVASGVNPVLGMITGIWAGIIGALCGGSNYNVIGMTGALTGIIASYVLQHGPETVPTLAVVSGIFILGAYLTKLERYLIFIPSSVIHGFTLGVALMLFLGQINGALGLENVPKKSNFLANVIESFKHVHEYAWHSVFAFCFFFLCLLLLRKLMPRVPGAIIVAPLSIVIGYLTSIQILPLKLQTLGNQFGTITPLLFKIPTFYFTQDIITPAIVIAFIAILETMLAAKIADVLTKTKHNARKEMFGLAIANIVSGLVGGVPASAALARTTFNINAGATNALSALFSSISMIGIAFVCLSYFAYMPVTAIAAMLIFISITMVEQEHFKRLYIHDKPNFYIAVLVALIMVAENPIIGILSGAVMALLLLIHKLAECNYEVVIHELHKDTEQTLDAAKKKNILVYAFKGKLVYLNSQAHILRFQTDFTQYDYVVLELQNLYYIDLDGIDALEEIIEMIEKRGQTVYIIAPSAPIGNMLQGCPRYKELEAKGFIVANLQEILRQAN